MLRILNPAETPDRSEWLARWNSWPGAEIFAHPAYLQLYANRTTAARCALYERDGVSILYPFLVRDLVAEGMARGMSHACDITSAYGYGGAFVWGGGRREPAAASFWPQFGAWAAEQGVVSEFVRFSVFGEQLLPYPGVAELRSQNVVRTLQLDDADLWMDFDHKVRKNVARARRGGVTVEVETDGRGLADFQRIYHATMARRCAPERYSFSNLYFHDLTVGLAGHIAYFHAMREGLAIATELVLISAESVYSFLGGTDERYFEQRPNDLLKYEIILWAKRHGKKYYVLGGGYGPEDGIFKYKRSFAPAGIVPFYVGKRILREDLYRDLAGRCEPRDPRYFPAYRSQ